MGGIRRTHIEAREETAPGPPPRPTGGPWRTTSQPLAALMRENDARLLWEAATVGSKQAFGVRPDAIEPVHQITSLTPTTLLLYSSRILVLVSLVEALELYLLAL